MKTRNIASIIAEVDTIIEQFIEENCTKVSAEALGLDPRCGNLYVCDDGILTEYSRVVDYYGGFEYVDKDYRNVIGKFTIYSNNDDRIFNAIGHMKSHIESK